MNSSFHLSDILVARGVRLSRHRGLVAELCALTAGDLMEVYSLVAGGRWLLAPSLELSLASEVPGSWALGTLLCKHRHSGPRVWRNLATFLPTPAEISLWQCSKSNMQTILLSCSSICRRGEEINIKQIWAFFWIIHVWTKMRRHFFKINNNWFKQTLLPPATTFIFKWECLNENEICKIADRLYFDKVAYDTINNKHMSCLPENQHLGWVRVTFLGDFSSLSWAYFFCKWAKILICWCLTLLE